MYTVVVLGDASKEVEKSFGAFAEVHSFVFDIQWSEFYRLASNRDFDRQWQVFANF